MSKKVEDILGWIFFSFFIIVLCIGLQKYGVAEKTYAKEYELANEQYVTVSEGSWYAIVYDKDTKVMYSKSTLSRNYGILTLLVNPDGTPRLYEEEE